MILDYRTGSCGKDETMRLFDLFIMRMIGYRPCRVLEKTGWCIDVMRIAEVVKETEAADLKEKYGRIIRSGKSV